MKNLESLNLQELSIEEQVNTDGGAIWIPLLIAAALLAPTVANAPTK